MYRFTKLKDQGYCCFPVNNVRMFCGEIVGYVRYSLNRIRLYSVKAVESSRCDALKYQIDLAF